MCLDFGSIPHKVNMAAKTIVSPGTRSERSDVGGVVGGMPSEHSLWQQPFTLSNGNYLVLCTRLFTLLHADFPLKPFIDHGN